MIKNVFLGCLFFLSCSIYAANSRPNIIVIMTDQQRADMLSCAGNQWLKTPNLDKLAKGGVRFEKAYASNPVCVPSRFSIQTGLYPSAIKMRFNESEIDRKKHDELIKSAMGWHFKEAEYETYYGGKVHLPTSYDDASSYGYTMISKDHRDDLAEASAEFLKARKDEEKPFLLFVSFINPHDICYMALRQLMPGSWYDKNTPDALLDALVLPKDVTEEELLMKYLPPIPFNFEPTKNEPLGNKELLNIRPYRLEARENWTERDWRLHRWAYHRLTEHVDGQIGIVLDALGNSEVNENTIVLFTSDHGDMDASHRLEHKTFFYEESTRIPLIIAGAGIKKGVVDKKHLINNGLDIYPTLCDLANITMPETIEGRSIASIVSTEKEDRLKKRKYIFTENQVGYMVFDGRYKYQYFDVVPGGEMLIDLKKDPGEMLNVVDDKNYKNIHVKLKEVLFEELKRRGVQIP